MKITQLLFFGIFILFATERAEPYEYSEKDQWPELYEGCAGDRQSPIDLSTTNSTSDHLCQVVFIGYEAPIDLSTTVLRNNGHSVQLTGKTTLGIIPSIMLDLSIDVYEFGSLHFHWGSTDSQGSEHLVNGQKYSMELHIVHINNKYESMQEAQENSDGLAVLGIFFDISEEESTLGPIVEHLDEVVLSGSETRLTTPFSLNTLINGLNTDLFFKYDGSLTTPNCSESVTWIVYEEPLPITENELLEFRQLLDDNENPIVDNYRNPQPIGDREIIYRSPVSLTMK